MKKTLLLTAALLALPAAAMADAGEFEVGALIEWKHDWRATSESASKDNTHKSSIYAELSPELELGHGFELDSTLVFEQFEQAQALNSGDDIWFDRQGLFAEELYVEYENGAWEAKAGKFNPAFGKAFERGRGFGVEAFAEDYELSEKVGVGAAYTLDAKGMGEHTLSVSTFFNDTSFLSGSAITARDETNLNSGGAGNTEDFSSAALQVEGEDTAGIDGLGYRLGYHYLGEQEKGRNATTSAQSGFVAGADYTFKASDQLAFDTLIEYTMIEDQGGVKGEDFTYTYASVITKLGDKWNVKTGVTFREDDGAIPSNDVLGAATVGYKFGHGLALDVGYRGENENNRATNIYGFKLSYAGEWESQLWGK